MNNTMTYEGYLAEWESRFGDTENTKQVIFRNGREIAIPLRRMTRDEHANAVANIEVLNDEWRQLDHEDDVAMQRNLDASFAYEVALFI